MLGTAHGASPLGRLYLHTTQQGAQLKSERARILLVDSQLTNFHPRTAPVVAPYMLWWWLASCSEFVSCVDQSKYHSHLGSAVEVQVKLLLECTPCCNPVSLQHPYHHTTAAGTPGNCLGLRHKAIGLCPQSYEAIHMGLSGSGMHPANALHAPPHGSAHTALLNSLMWDLQ